LPERTPVASSEVPAVRRPAVSLPPLRPRGPFPTDVIGKMNVDENPS
jgi:hypothetical protein